MKHLSFAVFVWFSAAFAEPLFGPATLPYGGNDLHVVKHNYDVIEVFYRDGGTCKHYGYSIEWETVLYGPHNLPATQAGDFSIQAAAALADSSWAVALNRRYDHAAVVDHESYIVRGRLNNNLSSSLFYESEETGGFASGGPLTKCRIAAAPNGSFAVAGVETGTWGVEPSADAILYIYPGSHLGGWFPAGGHDLGVFPTVINSQTVSLLSFASVGGGQIGWFILGCEESDTCSGFENLSEWFSPPDAAVTTEHGRHLYIDRYDHAINELFADGSILATDTLPEDWGYYSVSASHARYGMALAYRENNHLKLLRVDTTGTRIESDGMLVWNAAPGNPSSIQIDDAGVITVAWGDENCIIIPWDEPLGALLNPAPAIPNSISLSAYPNPFNSEVRITYLLPVTGDVDLSVYNIQGQLVERLMDERVAAGEHLTTWKPDVGTGVYFVSLLTEDQQQVQKILYLK